MVLESEDVVHARERESSHSHAEDAMGVGSKVVASSVLVAMGLDGILLVIAELVEGMAKLIAWFVTRILRLEAQGLTALTAPARPKMQ